jgi:CheY-like chemotaxis protein
MAYILIAEDEAFTAMALIDVLEERGHTVRDAVDGAAAISVLESFSPDVLVTDLMMPNVDGAALISHVRALTGPSMAIILITGVPESKLPGGMAYDAYLGKPVDHDLLGRLVASLVGGEADQSV